MPTIALYTPSKLGPKDWGTELLVAHTAHYTGKVLTMKAGHGGPLQYHERKDEAFYVFSGTAQMCYHDSQGRLLTMQLQAGDAVHIPPGAVHQVEAITDCVLFETSTPVFEDRVAV